MFKLHLNLSFGSICRRMIEWNGKQLLKKLVSSTYGNLNIFRKFILEEKEQQGVRFQLFVFFFFDVILE